jgi:hypothetical protein
MDENNYDSKGVLVTSGSTKITGDSGILSQFKEDRIE